MKKNIIKYCLNFFLLMVFLLGQILIFPKTSKAAGASLYLTPAAGTYVIGGTFNVAVKVNSGGEEMNAAEGTINFDKNLLEVTNISNGGSIFPFWTVMPSSVAQANASGAIKFGGGMSPPFFKGTAGHIITIFFKAKKSGNAQVRFAAGAVLANDGKGTNILASMGSAAFVVSPKVQAPPQTKKETPKKENKSDNSSSLNNTEKEIEREYNKPVINSETNPDQNRWSNKNNVKFNWELPKGVTGVSIAFNENPVDDPGPKSDGEFTEKEYNDVEDGIWYLHLKFKDSRKWGTISHYRVMIDTKAPDPFDLKIREIDVGDWPMLEFETQDNHSGLFQYVIFVGSLEEKNYILKASSTTEKEKKSLKLEDLNVGYHTAIVRAIDNAGNETISTVKFEIKAIETPEIKNYSQNLGVDDRFFVSGKAPLKSLVNIYLQKDGVLFASTTVEAENGDWFYVYDQALEKGRYVAWVEAVNSKGIKSNISSKITFLVSPPVFALIGDYVIDYFTIFVSLLFMIVLIIALIVFVVTMIRKKIKKETIEIEEVLQNNLKELKDEIDKDFAALKKYEGKTTYTKQKLAMKNKIKKKVDMAEAKILKEIKDVEKLLN